MAIQLKTFPTPGVILFDIDKIPSEIAVHIRQSLKYHYRLTLVMVSIIKDLSTGKNREFLKVNRWGYEEIDGKKIHWLHEISN